MTGQLLKPRALEYGRQITYTIPGAVVAAAGSLRLYNDTGFPWEIGSIRATLLTAGITTTTVDVNVGGASVFAAPADRPSLASGEVTAKVAVFGTTTVPVGAYLTIDVDAAGTGADTLLVQIAIR